MTSRRSNVSCSGNIEPSPSNSNSTSSGGNRKQSIINPQSRVNSDAYYDRKLTLEKPGYANSLTSQVKNVTVSSLKTRLAPTIRSALTVAVDTLLGEVVFVLNETQQQLLSKEQENERLKVRLEVSEREMRTLQECLSSAQKLIDQLQIPYSGSQTVNQSVFAPSMSSMGSMNTTMERTNQSSQNVNGSDARCEAGVILGLGGPLDESLHGYDNRDDYKMCQLSIQPDGSVTNHSLDSFGTNPSICSDSRPDDRQSQGGSGGSRFEVKEEQGPGPGPSQPCRRAPGPQSDGRAGEPEQTAQSVGELGHIHVVEEEAAARALSYPLRHPRPMRPRSGPGADGQKPVVRPPGPVRGDNVSPGRAEDSAGPSTSDLGVEPDVDRPHHCLECGKTFRLISSLKKHIRIHTGEKPYPCSVCGRRFRESGALKTHLRIHTGEKPYSCSECGNSFRHLDGLRKHRRTHTGEKPYVCAICGKRLSRLQHLKHHQLIHTGERPCSCPFCHRSFKEPAALRKHVRTHRDEPGHLDGNMAAGDEIDPDAMDDMNNLHPAAPSPQMRFGEWGAEGEDTSAVDCV